MSENRIKLSKYKIVLGNEIDENNRQLFIDNINELTEYLSDLDLKDLKIRDKMRLFRRKMIDKVLPFLKEDEQVIQMPYVRPAMYISKSIALVGNSKNLYKSSFGNKIDSYTNIFRFKYAQVEGNEQDVGFREDIRCACVNNLKGISYPSHTKGMIDDYKFYNNFHNTRILTILKNEYHDPMMFKHIAKRSINMDIKTNKFYSLCWNQFQFREIIQTILINKTNLMRMQYGTGLILLLTDLGLKPDLYGFDMTVGKENLEYYWSKIVKLKPSRYHNISFEQELIAKLHDTDKINLFISSDEVSDDDIILE